MAITLEQHTVNRINNLLVTTKPARLRELVDHNITEHQGVVPNRFIPLHLLREYYYQGTEGRTEPMMNFLTIQLYQALSWLYSRHNIIIDPRLRTEVLMTKPDKVFHGEVLRRLPEWTVRLEVSYLELDEEDGGGVLGIDMLVSRATVDDKDAAIITLTNMQGDKPSDVTYRSYVLDLHKDNLLDAVLSLPEWNTNPIDDSPFDPAEIGMLERFLPCLMFVCSQLPTQTAHQGIEFNQNVKVKQKGKKWVLQPANKMVTHCVGEDLANSLYEDADYVERLTQNVTRNREGDPMPIVRAEFIGEWDDPDAEDPTFHYDWIPPVFEDDEKNKEENPS